MRFKKTKGTLMSFVRIAATLASIFALYWYFRWAGLRGVISLLLGMVIMAIILLSKNPMVLWLIEQVHAEQYMKEVRK
jgi:hypothetical protein